MTTTEEPLHFVPDTNILANQSLSLAFSSMVHPDVAAVANGVFQGMTGRKPECRPGHRKSIWFAGYSFGVILAQHLPDPTEDEPCPAPTSSSAPTKRPRRRTSPAGSSSTS